MSEEKQRQLLPRRRILGLLSVGAVPVIWQKPIVNMVMLPAHAQTTTCVADSVTSGPLIGNPFSANSCTEACTASVAASGGELCSVNESIDPIGGGVLCECNVDSLGAPRASSRWVSRIPLE